MQILFDIYRTDTRKSAPVHKYSTKFTANYPTKESAAAVITAWLKHLEKYNGAYIQKFENRTAEFNFTWNTGSILIKTALPESYTDTFQNFLEQADAFYEKEITKKLEKHPEKYYMFYDPIYGPLSSFIKIINEPLCGSGG